MQIKFQSKTVSAVEDVVDSLTDTLIAVRDDFKTSDLDLRSLDGEETTLQIILHILPHHPSAMRNEATTILSNLSAMQLKHLKTVEEEIEALASAEILRSLKTLTPVSESHISLVKKHFQV